MRWTAALTRAGIADPRLQRAYDVQRRLVRRFAREEYVAARLLLPAPLHPSVIAAVAYMHTTDELIDTGKVSARQAALRHWDEDTTAALEGSEPPAQPTLLALWDTARRHPHIAARVRAFLDGAAVEASLTGFDSEADFQTYVDSYSLPALMLTASLIAPFSEAGADEPFVRGCRALIEGWQRCDFLADLSEDADRGRIGIPREELDRYGLKFEDVRSKSEACVPALEHLVVAQADRAEKALTECRVLPSLAADEYRPFLHALIGVQELRLLAVKQAGGSLLRRKAGPGKPASLRVLARQYRLARTQQRQAQ
jgi:phytoene synthase